MSKAAIFDIDGTILDSVKLHAQAWEETFQHFGHNIPLDDIRNQIGKGGDQLLPTFLTEDVLESKGKEIEEFRSKVFKDKYLSQVKPFPKVRELFQKVLDSGQKLALASSAKGDELKLYERIANVEDLVDVETSSADAEKSKPHPDIFLVALERLGGDIPKDEIIVIGDSPYDAIAATKAGLRTIGVLGGGFSEATLREAGCIAIFKDPADLLEKFDQSPLGQRSAASAS